jgi:hypothetical protein
MATDSILGLFTSPQQYQQALQTEALGQGIKMAQLSPLEAGRAMGYAGAAQVGRGLVGALGGEDPMLQQLSQRQQLLRGIDFNDPTSLANASRAALERNDVQASRELAMAAEKARAAQLESAVKTSQITRNLREGNAAILTADQKNFAQAKDDGYKGTFNQWLTEQKRAGASNISLSATADKSYGSELGGLVAKSDIAARDVAMAAPDNIANIKRTRDLLNSGKVFTGTGANAKLNVLALGQAFGITGATDNEIITNTQQLQQQRAKAVLSQIKSSGLGSGQGFTDKDLIFLERASAGNISLSADTIREQLNIEEKLAKAATNKWNKRVQSLPPELTRNMGLTEVQIPPDRYNPAAGIPTTGLTGNPLIDKYLVPPSQGK